MGGNRPLFMGDKLMSWRMAQAARLFFFPWRVSALVWQEYWRTWHAVWRGPEMEPPPRSLRSLPPEGAHDAFGAARQAP